MKVAEPPPRLCVRLGWFVLLYAAGVLAVIGVAMIFRLLMPNVAP